MLILLQLFAKTIKDCECFVSVAFDFESKRLGLYIPYRFDRFDNNMYALMETDRLTCGFDSRYCPPSLQSYIVRLVIEAIKLTCKKQPEICGLRQQEKSEFQRSLAFREIIREMRSSFSEAV